VLVSFSYVFTKFGEWARETTEIDTIVLYATLFAVHQQQQKINMKKRETETNNQKTNIIKKTF